MAKISYGQLADWVLVVCQIDFFIEHAWPSVSSRDVLQLDSSPCRSGGLLDGRKHLLRASPEGNEINAFLVESIEVSLGGELGVKNEFVGNLTRALLPIGDKRENFVVLFIFTKLPIGIAKHPSSGILSQKGEHPLLPAAALGAGVLLPQRIVAVVRNGMEVEVEGGAVGQAQGAGGIVPKAHEDGIARGIDAATLLSSKSPFGHDVETGEEGQAFVKDIAHNVAVSCIAKEFSGQQSPHGLCGGDLC